MRVYTGIILLVFLTPPGRAQQVGCSLPVSITIHDLSSLPTATAERMAIEWKRNIQAKKYELPNGKWDWRRQSWDFQNALIGQQAWDNVTPSERRAMVSSAYSGNLPPEAFVARDKTGPIRVVSATYDRGPRRIVFVAENARKVPAAARKIEAAVITRILSKARSQDSFAFIAARGPRVELPFGSSREVIRAAAEELESPAPGRPAREGALDAILEATTWFQPAQTGDSILVMTMGLERKHKASFSKVRAAVAAGGIRVFAVQLGLSQIKSLSYGLRGAVPYGVPDSDLSSAGFGLNTFFRQTGQLSDLSGGTWVVEDTEGKTYQLTDEHLNGLMHIAERMYETIVGHYILQLDATGLQVSITLAPSALERLPWVLLRYPEYPPKCVNTSTMHPAEAVPRAGSRQHHSEPGISLGKGATILVDVQRRNHCRNPSG